MFTVYFDAITGRPGACPGDVPVEGDLIARFQEERDASRLRSELASERVVALGLVQRDPVVDGFRDLRVQALYERADEVARDAPFAV
jgi:hypothetical protein